MVNIFQMFLLKLLNKKKSILLKFGSESIKKFEKMNPYFCFWKVAKRVSSFGYLYVRNLYCPWNIKQQKKKMILCKFKYLWPVISLGYCS